MISDLPRTFTFRFFCPFNFFVVFEKNSGVHIFAGRSENILEELTELPRTLLIFNIFFMSCKFELHKKVSLSLEESLKTFMVFLFLGKL